MHEATGESEGRETKYFTKGWVLMEDLQFILLQSEQGSGNKSKAEQDGAGCRGFTLHGKLV